MISQYVNKDGEEVAQSATDLPKPPLDQPKSTPEGPAVALPGAAPDDRKKGDTKKTIAESTPDVKVEFPPFNYTPTVTTQTIDYDLDATSSPGNSTQSQGEVNTPFWKRISLSDNSQKYLKIFGVIYGIAMIFWLGVLYGRTNQ